jgi:hypothetical protein
VIVRREADGWTLIRQMDHAAHCGEISRAWRSGPFGDGAVSSSLEYAAGAHDLGWAEVDGLPEIDGEGRPRNFTTFEEARHAAFYSAAVRTIAKTDKHAAYLVSLHATGLYSRRFAWTGFRAMDWKSIGDDGRALLSRERAFRADLQRALDPVDVEFDAAWRAYMLLETFDFLSLLTCFGLESVACGPVPSLPGQFEQLTVTRLGPWEVALDPFPFPGRRLELEVESVHLDAGRFASSEELQAVFKAAHPQRRTTAYLASQP